MDFWLVLGLSVPVVSLEDGSRRQGARALKKSGFTEDSVVKVLRGPEPEVVAEVAKRHAVSE